MDGRRRVEILKKKQKVTTMSGRVEQVERGNQKVVMSRGMPTGGGIS